VLLVSLARTREPLAGGFLSGKRRLDTKYGDGDVRAEWPSSDRMLFIRLAESFRNIKPPDVSLVQASLRFVLDEPTITTTIAGIKTPAQAREDFEAVNLSPFEWLCDVHPKRSA
jgi:aryl-alcohol dehydrogenase-like predicted oxidoreductase